MNSKTTKAITTAAVGVAVAASSLAFTFGQSSSPSDHDSFRTAGSVSVSDHDSFGPFGASVEAGAAQTSFEGQNGSTASHLDRPSSSISTADAPSVQDSTEAGAMNARELDLDFGIGEHDTNCTRVAITDLTIRAALDCGLDAADWALVTASNTYRQTRDNVDVVVDAARSTVDTTAQQVKDTVNEVKDDVDAITDWAVDTVKDTASDVLGTTNCIAQQAGEVLDTSARDLVDCV